MTPIIPTPLPNSNTPLTTPADAPLTPLSKSLSPFFIVLAVALVGIALTLGYQYHILKRANDHALSSENVPMVTPFITKTPTPTPTPIILQSGDVTYNISHGRTNGPTIMNMTFHPLDVKESQPLTLSMQMRSTSVVSSVTGTLQGDKTTIPLNFTKITEKDGIQTWSTQLTVTDTIWYSYVVTVTATNETGNTTVTVAPRS